MTKTCFRCREAKPVDAFGRQKVNKDGLSGTCRSCRAEMQRVRRATDPDYAERQRISSLLSGRRRYVPKPRRTPEWEQRWLYSKRVTASRWHAKKFGAKVNDLRLRDWLAILEEYGNACHY